MGKSVPFLGDWLVGFIMLDLVVAKYRKSSAEYRIISQTKRILVGNSIQHQN